MIADIFNEVKTYSDDLPLFKELGLKPFHYTDREEHLVGTVKDEYGTVKIYMTGLPAQFWRFEVHNNETKKDTEFGTGSGTLSEYWNFAKAIMLGMVVIK